MEPQIVRALNTTIENWKVMTDADMDHGESTADEFETSFYRFIDEFRSWVNRLEQRPQSLEQLLALPMSRNILDRLPEPLILNFETEAELILDHQVRIDEDKVE